MQALWTLLASAMFAIMGSFVKLAAEHQASMPQIVLFRGAPSVVVLLLWAHARKLDLAPIAWRPHLIRNITGVTSMWLGFYAIASLPLATATSLTYTAPLFIAGWILVRGAAHRDPVCIVSVVLGFLGVLAVLQPSLSVQQLVPAALGLLSGGLAAIAMMQLRSLGRMREPEWRTVLIFSAIVVASSAIGLAIGDWGAADRVGWGSLLAIGVSGLVGQLAMTRAFGQGSALLNAALQYTPIIFAALIGLGFWDESLDVIAVTGIVCVISAGLLSIWRTMRSDAPAR